MTPFVQLPVAARVACQVTVDADTIMVFGGEAPVNNQLNTVYQFSIG